MRTRTGRLLERWGQAYDRLDRVYHRVLAWSLDRPWTVARRRHDHLRRQPLHDGRDRHRVRARRRTAPSSTCSSTCRPAPRSTKASVRSRRSSRRSAGCRKSRQIFSTVGRARRGPLVGAAGQDDGEGRTRRGASRRSRRTCARCSRACRSSRSRSPTRSSCRARRTSRPINIFVRGDDMKELQRISDELLLKIRQVPGARRRVSSSLVSGQPEMVARVHRDLAADLGFSVGRDLGAAARHGRGDRPDEAPRRRSPARHPGAARAGVPQRLRGHRAHAALLALRLGRPHRRRGVDGARRSGRAASSASSAAARPRSASTSSGGRSAT